ncbi:5' exonuclease Apollo-like [Ostrea edulis]|uniref:5' exonuclease Apollo-like n=1 Tax=Ostrea edulis TaxID=37623 RepID=UPI0024AF6488|nr:5' exonuclease Apollo-like [Ostrea edulis]XP_048741971.2 5' exonuclease Apollo-like [Ostrea edulis]XP_056000074.1 5' exonuclease Apollo-like [Ostrea edulis]
MNGKVIPRTPIAVDFWKIRECPNARLFFLTHLHGDHTVGLTSSWQHKIYCSEITGKLLEERYEVTPSLICPLETGCSHVMYVDSDQVEQMSVTVIDAHHCPGSVMYLFEGYFGKILYTGDFRFDSNMKNDPLMLNLSNTDIVYLDNTYNSPRCVFPSREESQQQVLEIIGSHPGFNIKIGLRNLGKEDLLVVIAQVLQEWIKVSPIFLKVAELLDLPDVFITGETDARIEVVPFYSISNKNIERWNNQHPTIAILPTSLYTGLEMSPFCNQENVFIVPYSDHSSFNELIDFVKLIKPSCVYPIVSGKGRGPFGLDITDRADVSMYKTHLGKPRTRNAEIPDSVKRWMCGTRTLPPAKVFKKKPLALTRSRQSLKKGVHFDDSKDEVSEPKPKKNRTSDTDVVDDDGKSKPDENFQLVVREGENKENSKKENLKGNNSVNTPVENIVNSSGNEDIQSDKKHEENCDRSSDIENINLQWVSEENENGQVGRKDHLNGKKSENPPDVEIVNTRENEGQAKTKKDEALVFSHICTKCVKERKDQGDTGRNSTGRKRQPRKSFLLYVTDTDMFDVDDTSETRSTEKNKDNQVCSTMTRPSCLNTQSSTKPLRNFNLLRVVPISQNTKMKCRRSTNSVLDFRSFKVIPISSKTKAKSWEKQRSVISHDSIKRPSFNVKPL